MQSYFSEENAYMSPDSSSPASSADSSPSLEPMDLDLTSTWNGDTDVHIHDPYSGSQYARRPPRMYERRGDAAPFEPASSLSTPPVTPPPTQEPAAVTITHDLDDLWGDDEEPTSQQIEFRAVPDTETYETERKLDAWRETISATINNNTQTIDISDKGHTFIPDEVSDLASITILQEDHARHLTSARSFGKSESKRKLGSGAQTLGLELNLAANRISVIPPALFALENLTFLSLRGNSLEHLPPQIYRLRRLEILNVANNLLRYLPGEICDLPLKQLNVYPNERFLPDPSTGKPHSGSSPWRAVTPVEVSSSVPTLREIILRYLLSPNVSEPTAPHSHMPTTPHNSPMRQRGPAKSTISNLAAYIQLPLSPSDLPPSAHILQTHEPGLIARQSFSRVSTAASIASTARGDPEPKGVSHCMSPMHGYYQGPGGMGPPYVEHVEQRIVWAHSICGIVVGSSSHGGVPLLWRGCERGCLEFLDGSSSQG
ncbi:hypothetical protein PENSPDRAFT_750924 [Peniophora sp. CONT]|nr:hypothetical protein PENSPDRAFT_750924 [Peniophora sp. CONT]